MPKEQGRKLVAQNRKARHDYHIDDVYEAGLVLTGTEVKSLRAGHANLVDGFAHIRDGEAWLAGVHIPEYTEGTWTNHEPRRERKLLLHKAEIVAADRQDQGGRGHDGPARAVLQGRQGQGRDRAGAAARRPTTSGRRSPRGSPTARCSGRCRGGSSGKD